jgi:hypothetical protein
MEKKTRQVVHTAEDPPNLGSSCLATIGSATKSRKALRKIVSAYRERRSFMAVVVYLAAGPGAPAGTTRMYHRTTYACLPGKVTYLPVTDIRNQRDVANLRGDRYCFLRGSVLGEGCSSARP